MGIQSPFPALAALTYFDNADDEPPPTMLWEISWEAIKHQFEQWVRELAG